MTQSRSYYNLFKEFKIIVLIVVIAKSPLSAKAATNAHPTYSVTGNIGLLIDSQNSEYSLRVFAFYSVRDSL